MNEKTFDARLPNPLSCLIVGPSSSGKTTFLTQLMRIGRSRDREVFTDPRCFSNKVILYYNAWQPAYDLWKSEGLLHESYDVSKYGLPKQKDIRKHAKDYVDKGGIVMIFDDMSCKLTFDIEMLFLVFRQHLNINTFYLTQELFQPDEHYRKMSRNAQILVVFKTTRYLSCIQELAKQACPKNSNFLYNIYLESTKQPHSYLLFDFTQRIDESLRFRSDILCQRGSYPLAYIDVQNVDYKRKVKRFKPNSS